ncbi:MAG: glycosyltransferase [Bacteroidales bacterium]|nr:glycosyltransferase [Bacteroidales bacterium]
MRALMFGWEFPPHISGGLGTASYGLTRGLATIEDMEIIFVVPKAYGDEDQSMMRLIGAGDVPVTKKKLKFESNKKEFEYIEVNSRIAPYVDPEEFWKLTREETTDKVKYVQTNIEGRVAFSGKYGPDLLQEIYNYSVVASMIADENEFDLIHAHDWLTYPAGIAAKEASGKPLVIHVHATDFDRSGGNVNPDVYNIEKRGMDAADKIITVSKLTQRTVIEKYGIDPSKVITVYNAVEPLKEALSEQKESNLPEKIVTFLGRITLQKGPEYFIEAADMVLKKMKNVRFVMAGSGDMMKKMVNLAASKKIMDKFHFTGFLKGDEVFKMLQMSDVYIMPSVSEPFGISPLEAMQSNVPVIISNQSGVAEILTYAVKVDYWDIEAMADAIYGLLNYNGAHEFFKQYGREEVENLKWENAAQNVKDVYDSVL